MYHPGRVCAVAAILLCAAVTAWPAKKKKPEKEITQVLEVPKDPPHAIVMDVQRMSFVVTPPSAKGLLSQQVRDGLKTLSQLAHGAAVIKLRALVAGSGDLRRVQAIVSETFGDKRQPLPVLSVIQVGALPMEGAQVILEATLAEKKPVNEHGVAFVSGQPATAKEGAAPLQKILGELGIEAARVRRVTCFLNSLDHLDTLRSQLASAFPRTPATYVQLRRDSLGDFVECEAVAALSKPPQQRLEFAGAMEGRYSQAALVGPGKVILTGTQLAFRDQDADVRLAFDRLKRDLESAGGSYKNVAMSSVYPLTRNIAEKVRKLRFDYYDAKRPPASTLLLFEGLPSLDASFGIDVVAVLP